MIPENLPRPLKKNLHTEINEFQGKQYANSDLSRYLRIRKGKYKGNREQGTGNRNGGWRVDYEIVHAVSAAPFSNKCHCGASIAATGFSGISRLIFNAGTFPLSWLYRFARGFSCSLLTVPFLLPFAYPYTARYIRICMRLNG